MTHPSAAFKIGLERDTVPSAHPTPFGLHRFSAARGLSVHRLTSDNQAEVKNFIVRMRRQWGLEGPLLTEGHGDLDPRDFQRGGNFFILRNGEGQIIATLGYGRVNDAVCELSKLYVEPGYQSQGVGAALHGEALLSAGRDGYESMVLDTLDIWKNAVCAYQRWGYALYARADIPRAALQAGGRQLAALHFVKSLGTVAGFASGKPVQMDAHALEFTDAGHYGYPRAYNLAISSYSGWRRMRDWHLHAMKEGAEVVWDVGGGSAKMAERVLASGRSVMVLDLSPLMLELAATQNGFPPSRLHLCSALDIRFGSMRPGEGVRPPPQSVDHIMSHSVLWMLDDPCEFFQVAAAALRPGGRLSLSTILPSAAGAIPGAPRGEDFVEELTREMRLAMQEARPFGLPRSKALAVAALMVAANRDFASKPKNTWTSELLVAHARRVGLEFVSDSHHTAYAGTMGFWVFEKP